MQQRVADGGVQDGSGPRPPGSRSRWGGLARLLLVAATIVGVDEALFHTSALSMGVVNIVYPTSGLAIAMLVLWGRRYAWGVWLGSLVASVHYFGWHHAPPDGRWFGPLVLATSVSDALSAWAVATVCLHIHGLPSQAGFLVRLTRMIRFLLAAALLGPGISTAGSVAVVWAAYGSDPTHPSPLGLASAWWVSQLLGNLVIAPMMIVWAREAVRPVERAGGAWGLLGVLVLLLASGLSYSELASSWRVPSAAALVVPLPLLIWAALMYELRGATAGLFVASCVAILGTAQDRGPFAHMGEPSALVNMQLAVAVLACTMLVLGAVVEERSAQQRALDQQRQDLTDLRDRLRRLGREIVETEQRERRELAIRLHDGMNQYLAVARIELQTTAAAADEHLARARGEIDRALDAGRSVINDLAPPTLTALGLPAALSALARRFESEHGMPVAFRDDARGRRLSEPAEAFLYRAARELLYNALKHARATQTGIVLRTPGEPGGPVTLSVWDDGRGFRLEELLGKTRPVEPGFGLFSIQQHALALGGDLRVTTGVRTEVSVQVPG